MDDSVAEGTETAPRAAPHPTPLAGQVVRLLLLAVPFVVLVAGAWYRRAMSDDAFINLRIVREIYAGHGPVFNPGQRVEASTSPLWLALLTVLGVPFRRHLEWLTLWLNLVCSVVGLGLVTVGARRLQLDRADPEQPSATWWLPLGVLVLAGLTPMWTFAMAGLENGLSTLWLGASLLVLASWAGRRGALGWWGSVVIGLGPLVRPEFAIYAACFLVVGVLLDGTSSRRTRLARLGAALAAPVAYQVFRMGYYGVVFPTSVIAKSPTGTRWALGWRYLHNTFAPYRLWWALALVVLAALVPQLRGRWSVGGWSDRRALVVLGFVVGAVVNGVLVVRVGGDYMHARLLLPAITAFLAPVAVVPLRRRSLVSLASLAIVPWAVLCIGVWRSPADKVAYFVTADRNPVTLADFNVKARNPAGEPRAYQRPGVYLMREYVAPPPPGGPQRVVGLYGIGLLSFATNPETQVVDLLGLANPLDAHLALEHRGLNSHERPMPMPWFVALTLPEGMPYRTAPLFRGPDQREHLAFAGQIGRVDEPFEQRVAAARRALTCGGIADLQASYSAPMTPGRFLSNLVRAPARTFFTLPAEPSDAVRAECP